MQSFSQSIGLRLMPGRRVPAVPIAVGFACGIALDRWLGPAYIFWLAVGTVVAIAWLFSLRRRLQNGAWLLLIGCIAVGGARHHLDWSVGRVDDISLYADYNSRPIRLLATIESQPSVVPKKENQTLSAWQQYDRSVCTIRCRSIQIGTDQIAVSGLARMNVTGHLLHVARGDDVEIRGRLSMPLGLRNPGGFDYRHYLRQRSIRCTVRTEYPDAVRRIGGNGYNFLSQFRSRIRDECEGLFVKHLSSRTAPVARALLLGTRSGITSDVRDAFTESGTMHLLAISGLHVGILAAFLWLGCRVLNMSPTGTAVVLLLGIGGYAFITEARPPVIRAAILIFVTAAAWPRYRQVSAANTLAIAALIVLTFRPTDLFNVGAQLSFLAVIAIIWSVRWQKNVEAQKNSKAVLDISDLTETFGWWRKCVAELASFFKRGYVVTAAIWLFAAPLIAATFNLVSPVGLVINVLLVPVVVVTLWFGYGFMFCGLLIPQLATFFAAGFDGCLLFLLNIAEAASRFELGHLYVPQIPTWWLAGFYLLLMTVVVFRTKFLSQHWGWRGLWGWLVLGLAVGIYQPRPSGLHCTFLAVGHGCAVLLETPEGKTVLYDAGMINDGDRAQQIVQSAMWSRGLTRIDTLIVSHADIDHFNAIPGLLQRVPVSQLLLSQPFLDFDQRGVVEVCERAVEEGVPITLISAGDRILLDRSVKMQILHPQLEGASSRDNANSVVLLVEYEGKRILLTGDIEHEGTATLLTQPAPTVDVLMSPHHGSMNANSLELAAWASPRWVVVSKGHRGDLEKLRERYGPDVRVLSTSENGAITFHIDTDGNVQCSTFLGGEKDKFIPSESRPKNIQEITQRQQ